MTSLLFIGDSVTDCGHREDAPEFLGNGYVRLIADELPDRRVMNFGVSGNRVVDLLDRWDADVVSQLPEVLTVFVGINDTWRRYDSNDPTSKAAFEADYRACLSKSGATSHLVLVEPFVIPVEEQQLRWRDDLGPKQEIVARLAGEFGADFVPLQSLMTAAAANYGPSALAFDGVHPSPLGHRLIADAWLALFRGSAGPS
jgi:acyl-CoA thioesterase-1